MICAKHLCVDRTRSQLYTCPSSVSLFGPMNRGVFDIDVFPLIQDYDPKAYYAAYDAAKKGHLAALLAKINVNALEAAVSKARNGIPCRIPSLAKHVGSTTQVGAVSGQCGGQNCHVDIEFNDGVPGLRASALMTLFSRRLTFRQTSS